MLNPERLLGQLISGGFGRRKRRFGISAATAGVGLLGTAVAAFEQLKEQPKDQPSTPPPDVRPGQSERAMLFLQTMIAAGHADGVLDDQERTRVLTRAEEAGLSGSERALLQAEIVNPVPLDELVSAAQHHGVEAQLYAVALMAIEPEATTESPFLIDLAARLGLASNRIDKIERKLEQSSV